MTRNLKALGLALLAVFALGAIGAQVASAADSHQFKADGQKTIITGKNVGVHEFTVGSAGIVKCEEATFQGTVDAGLGQTEVDEITIKPTYNKCKFGGQDAFVFFNMCAYVFDSDTTEGNPTGGKHANVTIECSGGDKIEVHTVNCTVTVPPQTIPHAVRYVNDTASSTEVIATAHGIEVNKTRNTGSQSLNGCLLFPKNGEKVGKYIGTATNECFTDETDPPEGFSPTTPTGTKDDTTTTCSVTEI